MWSGPSSLLARSLVLSLVLLTGTRLVCAVPLSSFYPYGLSAGDSVLPRNDDGASSALPLPSPFNFFARSPTSLYVNNNGVLSFDAPVMAYTPEPLPISGSRVLLSPYWADVDTRPDNGGAVFYRSSTDPTLLNNARDQIRAAFPVEFSTFTPTYLFIATWDHVGYYNRQTDKNNTFQCLLMSDGPFTFASFLYADGLIQWTTGDASGGTNGLGGTPAQGGFNAGDGERFFSIPGSQTPAIINVSSTTNIGIPGVWSFRVDLSTISGGGGASNESINECAFMLDSCDENALCTDTAENYTCSCTPGFTGNGFICSNIDECALGVGSCGSNGTCMDTIGSYTCVCDPGYTYDGSQCINVDECTIGTHNCDENAKCTDTDGSFECSCITGYYGPGDICYNVNECENGTDNCHANAACTDNDGSFSCSCLPGFRGDGVLACLDINECTETKESICFANSDCVNIDGSYDCVCRAGYLENGTFCMNVNECDLETDNCHVNADCTDTIGSFQCTCSIGYSGDGVVSCNDIDECVEGSFTCNVNRDCVNTNGSYICVCSPGYVDNGTVCLNVDECADGTDNCHVNADCTDTIGSFQCTCSIGYSGDGVVSCNDIDECALGTYVCEDNTDCVNTVGSYDCVCSPGYTGYRNSCMNVDECLSGMHNCDVNANCTDTVGSFECTCIAGYAGDGVRNCTDVDECVLGQHNCDINADCMDIEGSFYCICREGYAGSGTMCTNVNECDLETDNCHVNADCTDTIGSFQCTCSIGYSGDGVENCTDIDECALGAFVCDPNAYCDNTIGSYDCICVDGYMKNGSSCLNVDECADGTDNCHVNADCADTIGSFQCTCSIGYSGDGVDNCTDIDECALGAFVCDPNAYCDNTIGSYDCICVDGYMKNGSACLNIDECDLETDNCHVNADCTDTIGSFQCTCSMGYSGDGVDNCTDIDECALGTYVCDPNAYCDNTIGSYDCVCVDGYMKNGSSCLNVNECDLETDNCHVNADCTDTIGSFQCTCSIGYSGDGVDNCTDIDECALGAFVCDPNAYCDNTIGSYDCLCVDGYMKNGSSCQNVNECADGTDNCHVNADCMDTIGSFQCTCSIGYSGDGVDNCTDIDECVEGTFICDPNAFCTNTIGLYTCTCQFGYSGDGSTCIALPVPEAPPTVEVEFVNETAATISWTAPPFDPDNLITFYNLTLVDEVFGLPDIVVMFTGSVFRYTFTGLEEYGNYTCDVISVGVFGTFSFPTSANFTTLEAVPTGPPLSPYGVAISPTLIDIIWLPPRAIDINGQIDFYIVETTELVTGIFQNFHAVEDHIFVGPVRPGYAYSCRVAAFTIGQGPFTDYFIVISQELAPSAPPDNVTALSLTSSSFLLDWDPPPIEHQNGVIRNYTISVELLENATAYNITTNDTEYFFNTLLPFYTYRIAIAASTDPGIGPWSSALDVVLPESAPSAPPQNIDGFALDDMSIQLTWDPPPLYQQNGFITSYFLNITERETGLVITRSTTDLQISLTNLHPYYVYECRVAAVTVAQGPYTLTFAVRVLVSSPSTPPLDFVATPTSSRSITLRWDPPLPEDRNGPITNYLINVTVLETQRTFEINTTMTTHRLFQLTPFTTYSFTIAASTEVGLGPFSATYSVQTPEDVPSEPRSFLVATIPGSPRSLSISWFPPEILNGIVITYTVYCTEEQELDMETSGMGSGFGDSPDSDTLIPDNSTVLIVTVAGNETGVTFPNLTPYTVYSCFASASTSAGEGNFTSPTAAQTDESVPDDAPGNLQAAVVTARTCLLTWSIPLIPNGVLISHTITYNLTSGDGGLALVTAAGNDSSYLITGLHPYEYYQFTVSASTRIGSSPVSTVAIMTEEASPATPPRNVLSFVIDPRSASISWLAPRPEDQNGIIRYYILRLVDERLGYDDVIINTTLTSHTFTNLEEYNLYSYSVAAATNAGIGNYSGPDQFITQEDVPTAAPQNITNTVHSATRVSFVWSPPPAREINGLLRFYIIELVERQTMRDWIFFAIDPDISISSLHPYYLYDFKVTAYTIDRGPYSAVVTVLTDESIPIAPPQEISADEVTSSYLALTWNPPPFEETNGIIRYYMIRVSEVDTGTTFFVTSNGTEITIPNLHPYYTYECNVAAFTVGLGPYSNAITIQLLEEAPTAEPQSVSGLSVGSDAISLSWSPPPLPQQNGMIRQYLINVTELETGANFLQVSTATQFTIYSLHPYYTYEFTLAAVTVGVGPASIPITVRTDEDVPSGPVVNPVIAVASSTSLLLSWEPPEMEDQNGVIISYVVNVTAVETGMDFELTSSGTTLVADGLRPFTTYICRIAARTTVGVGPFSIAITAVTSQDAPSGSPQNVSVSSLSSTSIFIFWEPPSLETQNGIITEYRVNITEIETGNVLSHVALITQISVQFLHPYYTYACIVSAVTNAEGPPSDTVVITTPEDVPNGYPQNFAGATPSSQSVALTWDPPPAAEQNGVIIGYTVNVTEADSGANFQLVVSANTSYVVSSLQPFTSYNFLIAAATSVGVGPFSRLLTIQTPEDVPENAPLSPTGSATNSRTIQFSWSLPLGRHNGVIREYRVNVTEVQTGRTFQRSVSTTSIAITSLQPSYTYRLSVSAYTVGEGPYSLPLNVTMPEDLPNGPPENISGMVLSSDRISLTWDPPLIQNRNGIITDYIVNYTALDTGEITQVVRSSRSLTVSSLAPFSTYAFIIAARTAIGAGPFSTDLTLQTLEDAPSSHPSNSTGYAINSTHIYLTWDPPPPEDVNGVIREYRINVTEVETGDLRQFTTPAGVRELVVGPLHPYYSYRSTIVAFTIEVGPYSTAITVRTEEAAPSGPPTNFVATVTNSRSIFLSWDPPLANQSNGILRYYFISLVSDAGMETRNISSSLRAVTVTGLRPFTQYSCTVQAGTVGVGPPTAALQRTTLEDAPGGAPQSVVAEAVSPTVFVLTWQPPLEGDGNGIVRSYMVNITELETGEVEQYFTSDLNITVTSRHPFYRYRYILAAETIGLGPFTDPNVIHMPEAAPASAPVSVAAASVTSTGFLLSWSSPPLEDHNGVIRNYSIAITELNTGNVVNLVSQTTSQLFDSLQPYYNYSVQVAAVTVAPGPLSTASIITTLEDVPSGSPQNLVIIAESSRSLRLTWGPPSEESRNGIIVGYNVFITPDSGATMETTTTATSYVASNLRPFTTYTCSVTARTSVGQGPLTAALLQTTPEDAPEAAPTTLVVHNITSTSISVSWEAPSTELQNGVIRHYQIVAFEVDTNTTITYRATANTAFTVGELHPYYTYQVAVQAVTVATGPLSDPVSVLTLQDVPSGVPLNIQAAATTSTTLSLTWDGPSSDAQNGVIVQYVVNISISETGERFQRIVGGAQTLILSGLHPYYEYTYIIAAVTSVGRGPFSVRSTIRMPQDVPSSSPLRVVGQAVNAERILLSWDLPEPTGRNGLITGYTIQILEVPTNLTLSYNLTNRTDFLVDSLHPYYDYQCSVAAVTVVGAGPLSAPVTVRTDESVPSGSPIGLSVRAINSTSIELIWAEPPPDTHNGVIVSYQINISVSETKTNFIVNATTAAALNITQLHPYYGYTFRVAAVTSQGAGPLSSPISITTPEDVPTGAPRNTLAAAVTSTSISFTWEPPSFELQNGFIRSYHINVMELETGRTWSYVIPGTETLLILNSLHPFYRYNYSIAANTTALGPAASTVIQTRQEAPSSVPGNIRVDIVSTVSVQVSWQPPPLEEQNGIITGYHIRVLGLNTDDNYVLPLVNDTSLVVESLHPFYAYRFSVAAQTVAIGPFSAAVTQKLPEGTPAGMVGDVQVAITSPSTISVSWLPTDKDDWNGVVQRYTVVYERLRSVDSTMTTTEGSGFGSMFVESISIPDVGQRLANNPDPTLVTLPLRREQVSIEGLEEYQVYQLSVHYETSQGRSGQSSPTTLQTLSSAPSSSPVNVRATSLSESTIRITWEPPPPLDRNGVLTGYYINITGVEDGVTKPYTVLAASSSLTVEGLRIYAEYTVTMAAWTQDGVGPYSTPTRVRTDESIPGPPTSVKVEALDEDSTSVEVTWQKPVEANGVITEYQVIYYGFKRDQLSDVTEIRDPVKTQNVKANGTRAVITGLTVRINYAFTVRARTSRGYGANSTTVSIEVEAPEAVAVDNSSSVVAAILATLGWVLVVVVVVVAIAIFMYIKRRRRKRGRLSFDTGSESELKELPPTLTGITRTNPTFRPDDADTELTEEHIEAANIGKDDDARTDTAAEKEIEAELEDDEVKAPLSDESSEAESVTKLDLTEI